MLEGNASSFLCAVAQDSQTKWKTLHGHFCGFPNTHKNPGAPGLQVPVNLRLFVRVFSVDLLERMYLA